jgi:hypothetical protein
MSEDETPQRLALPEPLIGRPVAREERQQWARPGKAEGELILGYDSDARPVRVEYHWWRWFSRTNPELEDVYTAELFVRQPDGDWLYIRLPGQTAFVRAPHERVRAVLAEHLGVAV